MSNDHVALIASYHSLSQFLYREAALLDERDWDTWGALFTAGGRYWVPAGRHQNDWVGHVSLANDTAVLRDIRLRRLKNGDAASLQSKPATSHLVSNVVIVESDEAAGSYTVKSRFSVAQFSEWGLSSFHGAYTHKLIRDDRSELRIELKRVDLVNVEGPLGDILTIL